MQDVTTMKIDDSENKNNEVNSHIKNVGVCFNIVRQFFKLWLPFIHILLKEQALHLTKDAGKVVITTQPEGKLIHLDKKECMLKKSRACSLRIINALSQYMYFMVFSPDEHIMC